MKTELKKVHLHTRRLLPAYIVDTARANGEDMNNINMSDTIMTWVEKEQCRHRFQPNDAVYDIDNTSLKMRVVQVLKKMEKVRKGNEEVMERRIKGVKCEYWT